MAINLVKSKVKELEELYSYLLTKYLESKGKGQTLTFDKNGLVSTTEKLGKPKMDRGYLTVAVNTNTSGYSIIFLPAGTKFTMVPKEDPSDQTVNRIWAGPFTMRTS